MPAITYEVIADYGFEVPFITLARQLVDDIALRYADDPRRIAIVNLAELDPIHGKQVAVNRIEHHKLETFLRRNRIDTVLMISIIEPHWFLDHEVVVEKILKPLGINYKFLGWYTQPGSTFFDLWSQVMSSPLTPEYSESDLLPIESERFFLCHTGNPMPHRVELYNKIADSGLLLHGYINLSKVGGKSPQYIKEDNIQNYSQYDIPHDPYTLGDLNIWRQTIFTVVSDAFLFESGKSMNPTGRVILDQPGNYGHTIISEKIYKPILGLRPFLVNGSYEVTKKFKDMGFDLFEDVLNITLDDLKTKQGIHDTIVRTLTMLASLTPAERLQWYTDLLPRLRANKQHFYKHAEQQLDLITQFQI